MLTAPLDPEGLLWHPRDGSHEDGAEVSRGTSAMRLSWGSVVVISAVIVVAVVSIVAAATAAVVGIIIIVVVGIVTSTNKVVDASARQVHVIAVVVADHVPARQGHERQCGPEQPHARGVTTGEAWHRFARLPHVLASDGMRLRHLVALPVLLTPAMTFAHELPFAHAHPHPDRALLWLGLLAGIAGAGVVLWWARKRDR